MDIGRLFFGYKFYFYKCAFFFKYSIKNSGGLITTDVSFCNILPNAANLREFVLEDPFQNKSTFSYKETTVSPKGNDETGKLNTVEGLGRTSTTSGTLSFAEYRKTTTTSGTLSVAEYRKCNETERKTTCSGRRNYYLIWFTFVLSIVPALFLHVA